jgi:predicted secreted protein
MIQRQESLSNVTVQSAKQSSKQLSPSTVTEAGTQIDCKIFCREKAALSNSSNVTGYRWKYRKKSRRKIRTEAGIQIDILLLIDSIDGSF